MNYETPAARIERLTVERNALWAERDALRSAIRELVTDDACSVVVRGSVEPAVRVALAVADGYTGATHFGDERDEMAAALAQLAAEVRRLRCAVPDVTT